MKRVFLLAMALTASHPTPASLPLDTEAGGLARSGKYFLQAAFDGHDERCLLDTGATDSGVGGTYFQHYQPVGRAGHKSAANLLDVEDAIVLRHATLGPLDVPNLRVTRHPADHKAPSVIGMDVLGHSPFTLRNFPKPALSWASPSSPLSQHSLHLYHGILAIPVVIGATPTQALWDTGANLSCVSPRLLEAHPDDYTFIQDLDRSRDGNGHAVQARLYKAKKLKVGSQTFRNLSVLVIDFKVIHENLSSGVDVILGFNAIRAATWSFDPGHLAWTVSRP